MVMSCCECFAQISESKSREILDFASSMEHIGFADVPSFSPDDRDIAFISDLTGSRQVWTIPVEGGYPRLVTIGDDSVPFAQWSPSDKSILAFATWPDGGTDYQLYTVHPDGSCLKRVSAGPGTKTFLNGWTADGKQMIIASNMRNHTGEEPYLLDPQTGKSKLLLETDSRITLDDVSSDRKFALIARSTGLQAQVPFILDLATHREIPLIAGGGAEHFYGKFGPDSRTVYCITRAGRERDVFARFKLDDGGHPGPLEVLSERKNCDLSYSSGWDLSDRRGTEAALVWQSDRGPYLELIDLRAGKHVDVEALPGERVDSLCFSHDGKSLAVSLSGPFMAEDIYLIDVTTHKINQLTFSPHAGVDFDALVKPELVKFKSFDGLELEGWLYRPKGVKSPIPFVIDFHGGPEAASGPTGKFQGLLNEGIGVFAPNIRGSSGRGKTFADLDNGPLRVNAIKDIKCCVDFLVDNKWADSSRIGISGHSYGGYLSMMGLSQYPTMFACGYDSNGPLDLMRKKAWLLSEFGDPDTEGEVLRKLSPVNNVETIRVPVMIQVGDKDDSLENSKTFVQKLRARNIPVEYQVLQKEGHNTYAIKNRIKAEAAKVEFFVRNLKR
ncbi:MAG: prolyl oligopeptidase family serine peptidase [Cyanobacteria bacterium REEB67]|nr:prolyl oligopeptidase family serine peptidase [Cyanobacteria bacterium REEB67]